MSGSIYNPHEFAGNWKHFKNYYSGSHEDIKNPELWGLVYFHNRDSRLLDESNWFEIEKRMQPYFDNGTAQIQRDSHWAVGWVEGIFVKVFTGKAKKTETKAYKELCEIQNKLDRYPVLNEEDYSEREFKATCDNIEDQYSWVTRNLTISPVECPTMDIVRWFDEHNPNALESRDDQGGYPKESDLLECLIALGIPVSDYDPRVWAEANGIQFKATRVNGDLYSVAIVIGANYTLASVDYTVINNNSAENNLANDILQRLYDSIDSELTQKFLSNLDDYAKQEFIDGEIEFFEIVK